jgi:hypothetical protein
MNYTCTVEQKSGYLHVRAVGDNTPENVRRMMADTVEACTKRDCKSVLLEEDFVGPGLGLAQVYELATAGSKMAWPAIHLIAFVDVNPTHNPENMKFAENVAVNRGVNVRTFRNVRDAEQWLISSIAADRDMNKNPQRPAGD